MSMSSSKPYMVRALYDWIVDNDCTPHIMVDAHFEGVLVPQQYVNNDGQIVLNIAPHAVSVWSMDLEALAFNARFGGVPFDIYVPIAAIAGIYAKENGQGMMFEVEPLPEPPKPTKKKSLQSVQSSGPAPSRRAQGKPSLRVVK